MNGIMRRRKIKRIAFLQEYRNRPDELKNYLPEISKKKYQSIALAVRNDPLSEKCFAYTALEALKYDLEVMAFTGYMKYDAKYLFDNPDQRLIFSDSENNIDQDNVLINWGCPFHPIFLQRYLDFLNRLSQVPNLTEVWVNDEADLGYEENSTACFCDFCKSEWEKEFGSEMPMTRTDDVELWKQYVSWRFSRWNCVHKKMKETLNSNRGINAVFLTSPACCFDVNPWITGVDLSSMIDGLDGLMTDPYYTFHVSINRFEPKEVYLSEHCRYIKSQCGEDKTAEICAQGFSHPTFTRALDERDGLWSGIIPLALGIDNVTAYTYLLQKNSPVQKPYEKSFELDPYFEKVKPYNLAALIDSPETQCYENLKTGADSWKNTHLLTVSQLLRHSGFTYSYLSSNKIQGSSLNNWPVVILPGVKCLTEEMKIKLTEYVKQGGLLVGFESVGDFSGQSDKDFVSDVFGIDELKETNLTSEFNITGSNDIFSLPLEDPVTLDYWGGVMRPRICLDHSMSVVPGKEAEVLANFTSSQLKNRPSIITKKFGKGRSVYIAGIPSRISERKEYFVFVHNYAGMLAAQLISNYIDLESLPVRAIGFPPDNPMSTIRPLDRRNMPTIEFMPSIGEDSCVIVVPSYFREPAKFEAEVMIPDGKKLKNVQDLLSYQDILYSKIGNDKISICIDISSEDCIKVIGVFWC